MEPERWRKIDELFHAALECDERLRAAFLAKACSGDDDLRHGIELLLARHEEAEGFLETPALERLAKEVAEGQAQASSSGEAEPSLLGRTVSHYIVLERLGSGGMGVVYKARDTQLGRFVALKFLRAELSKDPQALDRLKREARAASALAHPNIITIHEIGEQDGRTFIVMEWVDGKPLNELIPGEGMRVTDALRIAEQVAHALTAAHAAGIVHRDLKPANIVADAHGRVKVLDFGLAKQSRPADTEAMTEVPLTESGSAMGTIAYMSPEQARGQVVDARSDLWSFGVVLYEMVTGSRPFDGPTHPIIFDALLNKRPQPVRERNPEVPAELERIIGKLLEKDRAMRSRSAVELGEDLTRLQAASAAANGGRNLRVQVERWLKVTPIIVVMFLTAVVLLWFRYVRTGPPISRNSLIVLPFTNVTHDPNLEYVTDGLSESIIDKLSQVPGLHVLARTTAFTFKGGDLDVRKIGRDLKVRAVVLGRVSGLQDRLHVHAELVDSSEGSAMWGQGYDGGAADLLPIEQDIVQKLSGLLQVQLDNGQRSELARHTTQNREAYQWYLKGRYLVSRASVAEIKRGIVCFQRALEIDPDYGLAYTGLADSYLGLSGTDLAPKEAMVKARAAAERALEIDPLLPDAHVSNGVVRGWYEYDWDKSEREFARAIQLNPNDASARLWRAWTLVSTSRFTDGLAEAQYAHELDPLSPFVETGLAQMYCYAGKVELAVAQLRSVTESDPKFFNGHHYLGTVYLAAKQYQDAVSEFEQARRLDDQQPQPIAYLAYAHAMLGNRKEATLLRDQLWELKKTRYVPGVLLAIVSLGLDSDDQAIRSLEQAYDDRDDMLGVLNVDTLFTRLRRDSRFTALLRKIGFATSPTAFPAPLGSARK